MPDVSKLFNEIIKTHNCSNCLESWDGCATKEETYWKTNEEFICSEYKEDANERIKKVDRL